MLFWSLLKGLVPSTGKNPGYWMRKEASSLTFRIGELDVLPEETTARGKTENTLLISRNGQK